MRYAIGSARAAIELGPLGLDRVRYCRRGRTLRPLSLSSVPRFESATIRVDAVRDHEHLAGRIPDVRAFGANPTTTPV